MTLVKLQDLTVQSTHLSITYEHHSRPFEPLLGKPFLFLQYYHMEFRLAPLWQSLTWSTVYTLHKPTSLQLGSHTVLQFLVNCNAWLQQGCCAGIYEDLQTGPHQVFADMSRIQPPCFERCLCPLFIKSPNILRENWRTVQHDNHVRLKQFHAK